MRLASSYRSLVWTAVATGGFSAIVCAGLLVSCFGSRAVLPLDDPRYLALKQQLQSDKDDSTLQAQLHAYDATLRADYFRQLRFTRRGAYLLVGGVAVTLLLTHRALTVRRRLPTPKPERRDDLDARQRELGQLAAIAMIAVLTSLAFGSRLATRNLLPTSWELKQAEDPLPLMADNARADAALTQQWPPSEPSTEAPAPATRPNEDLPSAAQFDASWPRFRGPQGAGIAEVSELPETWNGSTGERVLWKTPVELPGVSSPIVWENRIFLTGATPQRREVYCFDADSGNLVWRRVVAEQASTEFKVEQSTGYAAPTAATDGRRVFAIFASGDVAAFDLQGHELWQRSFGPLDNPYGHGSSLATYKDRLIVQLDQGSRDDDKSRLLALGGATGEVIWEVKRTAPASWATPIVVQYEGQWRIIASGDPNVVAYAAEDGREIWRAACLHGDVGPSPVYADGVVYVANDNAQVAAIRDGGAGDVTESHLLWTAPYSLPDICSPLVTDQYLLLVASFGALVAYDRELGGEEPLWEADMDGLSFASPSLVGDRVYLIGEEGRGWVVRPGETGVERIAENELGERCHASPAFQHGRIYIRGEQHLFCIGAPGGGSGNGP